MDSGMVKVFVVVLLADLLVRMAFARYPTEANRWF